MVDDDQRPVVPILLSMENSLLFFEECLPDKDKGTEKLV
jgi:hypothetical protein